MGSLNLNKTIIVGSEYLKMSLPVLTNLLYIINMATHAISQKKQMFFLLFFPFSHRRLENIIKTFQICLNFTYLFFICNNVIICNIKRKSCNKKKHKHKKQRILLYTKDNKKIHKKDKQIYDWQYYK